MVNVHKGEVEIELDKERVLRYKTSSLVEAENKLGKPIQNLGEEVGIKEISILLWAALLHENKNLTIEEAMDLMDYGEYEEITYKILEALKVVFQKGSEDGKS